MEEETHYSITDGESEEQATYLSINTVVGNDLDPQLYVAFQVLEYTLLDAPGAPLKQALIDAGIGQDILGGYQNGILQPYFSVIAKNADKEQKGGVPRSSKGNTPQAGRSGNQQKELKGRIEFL